MKIFEEVQHSYNNLNSLLDTTINHIKATYSNTYKIKKYTSNIRSKMSKITGLNQI